MEKLNGLSKSYYEKWKLRSEENYINGKLNGISNQYYENKTTTR